MTRSGAHPEPTADDAQLAALGYTGEFDRSMSLWANMALGFTYLSPLVGVYSLFAYSLSIGGPPAIWWIVIVGIGQLMVSLVFGEVVSQYPLAGGIYPWTRRLWNRRYAWIVSWIYIWAVIVTITAVAEFGGGFVAALFGLEATPGVVLGTAVALLVVAFAVNYSGTRTLARIAQIGLAAELVGVIALGLFLLLFRREQPFSVFFDSLGAGGGDGYLGVFLAASLSGLFLFYGFEACGDVAEEVADPARQIPRAMILTILVGGVSGFLSYAGYVLAAPDLQAIVAGEDVDPIPSILESSLGTAGSKVFLVVIVVAFLSCVLSLQAAGSRLLYAFARDRMLPASGWLGRVSPQHSVPTNALMVVCVVPVLIALFVYFQEGVLARVTAFAVLGIYISFQAVVLAALRQRLRGWRPAGVWNLGNAGLVVNVLALAYGVFAIILLIKPAPGTETFLDRWIVAIGLAVVAGSGLLYLFIARPDRHSADIPEGDAREVAQQLEQMRRGAGATTREEIR
ncbi:APC family permease [Blastococcus saxobsidens]|uniref:Amino acid/polyamine/organocation transporter (APC superfamily) n=1 Tax=Blastococcus saxobsidens TaxID=138336 RepID=A0A4Q7Y6K0_9ACTN|nr:amino acid permease [Blastococcus saxobsidens]RZU32124.1 amino acid/polyamine/organocation transporter (APC superfamily) [Blastococcus saxobsidens]